MFWRVLSEVKPSLVVVCAMLNTTRRHGPRMQVADQIQLGTGPRVFRSTGNVHFAGVVDIQTGDYERLRDSQGIEIF